MPITTLVPDATAEGGVREVVTEEVAALLPPTPLSNTSEVETTQIVGEGWDGNGQVVPLTLRSAPGQTVHYGIYPGNGALLTDTPTYWTHWCNDVWSNVSVTTGAIWTTWATTTSSTTASFRVASPGQTGNEWDAVLTRFIPRERTAEEEAQLEAERIPRRAEQAQRAQEAILQAKQRDKARRQADRRAKVLLLRMLSREQREEYAREKGFRVVGSAGGRYRISHGWSGNVQELNEEGRTVATLCIHPRDYVPVEDNLLAQALLVQSDEAAFRRTANRRPVAPTRVAA